MGENSDHSFHQVRRQLERNDPVLTKLKIAYGEGGVRPGDYYPLDGDWERDGRSVGGNTHINEVEFFEPFAVQREDMGIFLRGLAGNKSITKLTFTLCDFPWGDIFETLVPFFKNNGRFDSLKICCPGDDCFLPLISALSEFNSLKEFEYSGNEGVEGAIDDDKARALVRALAGHSSLGRLILSENNIRGCDALATLLHSHRLALLDLRENQIDNDGAVVLAAGIMGSNTLNDLILEYNPNITETGWQAIFAALQSPSCRMTQLSLKHNTINDAAALSLLHALTGNGHLKNLDISCLDRYTITTAGWRTLSTLLQNTNNNVIENLNLCHNGLNEEVATSLANALANNCKLKSLNLAGSFRSTPVWFRSFSFLENPLSSLKELDLRYNKIHHNKLVLLANALTINCTLKSLSISCGDGIKIAAWRALAIILQNPNSALEKLHIGGLGSIDNNAAIVFANSLTYNCTLKELTVFRRKITSVGWAAFSRVLCNESTILGTYHSNHTLQSVTKSIGGFGFSESESKLPLSLRSLLEMNRRGKVEASRRKILKVHFSEESDVQLFIEKNYKMLPHFVAWLPDDEFSLLYRFVRNIPSFFEYGASGSRAEGEPQPKRQKSRMSCVIM